LEARTKETPKFLNFFCVTETPNLTLRQRPFDFVFLAFNLPYVLIPLLLLIRMRKPLPFTRRY
jgi:hypothetical protein